MINKTYLIFNIILAIKTNLSVNESIFILFLLYIFDTPSISVSTVANEVMKI